METMEGGISGIVKALNLSRSVFAGPFSVGGLAESVVESVAFN